MDRSESIALRYLESLKIGAVEFEPDGNVPPDFRVDGQIAVEVRRLNHNSKNVSHRPEGLEELAIPLSQKVRQLLCEFGPSEPGQCWYVGYNFRRPLEPWSEIRPLLETELSRFRASSERRGGKIKLTPTFRIDYSPAGLDHGQFFVLSGYMDYDAGGWVMPELDRNLRLCITQKEEKVRPYRSHYPTWWLVLIDHISHAIRYEDRDAFRVEVLAKIPHSFDRLVILDPQERRHALEA